MDKIFQFIRSQYPDENPIGLHVPRFNGKEKEYLEECIDTTMVSSVGPFVNRMERDLARYTGAQFAIATVNGTAALHIALQLVGVKRGDLVITQSFSFVATANAIHYTGAIPYFVDIEEESLGMNIQSLLILETELEKRADGVYHVPTNKRMAAVVPMHSFGMPCEIELIANWCATWGIPLVEDAAESLGSFYKGRHTGTWGKIGVMSFNGNKTITAGGGGVILTDDEDLARHAKHLTTQAKIAHPYEFIHDEAGYNYRCPNLNAALLCAQLEYLDEILIDKRNLASEYARFFEEYTPHFRFVTEGNFKLSNYWLNSLIFDSAEFKESFLKRSMELGIMVRPAWRPMHMLDMYRDAPRGDLFQTEWVYKHLVNLPSSTRKK